MVIAFTAEKQLCSFIEQCLCSLFWAGGGGAADPVATSMKGYLQQSNTVQASFFQG